MPYRTTYGDEGLGAINSTVTSLPVGYNLGEVRWNDQGTKKYRLFYNAGGASIATGRVCINAKGGVGLYSLTVSAVTEVGSNAMCCNDLTITVPTASYFWGLVYGYPAQLLASNISVGTAIAVTGALNGKVIPATVPTQNHFAINIGDSASAGVGTATTDAVGTRFFVYFEDRPSWANGM